jgi:hypothetical protein
MTVPGTGHAVPIPTVTFQRLETSRRGTRQGGGDTALGVAVTTRPAARETLVSEKNGGGTTLHTAVTRRCTTPATTVNIVVSGDTLFSVLLSRVQVGTALGVAVPPDRVTVPPNEHPALGLLSRSPP